MSASALNAGHESNIIAQARASRLNGTHATMDFETRSEVSVKKVGAFRYALDPSTEIMCLRYRLPGGDVQLWHPWLTESEPDDLFDWIAAGGIVEAHNAEFEYAIWNYIGHRRHNWPTLSVTQLRCSAAKAAALALPRGLEDLGIALKLKVQKDKVGHRLMLKVSKPRTKPLPDPQEKYRQALADFERKKAAGKKASPPKLVELDADVDRKWNESFEELERLFEYCGTDVLAEEGASEKMVPLIEREERTFQLTLRMNERGIFCDVPLCKTAVRFANQYAKELQSELEDVTDGEIQTAKQTAKILALLKEEGVEIENLQAPTVVEALKNDDLTDRARRVLEIRQALAQSSITKYQSMITCAGPDQRIRGTLLYHGASTGRYAGKLIQPQNFVKPKKGDDPKLVHELLEVGDYELFKMIFPNVFRGLAAGLRGMLRAAPGKVLYSGDFNAIEARVLLWLAGDDENLETWRTGADSYVGMASDIYERVVTKADKEERDLGKRAVLGCGFGMGPEKFFQTCAKEGQPISMELAEKAVKKYRKRFHKVRSFWYDLERAAIAAVKRPGTVQKCGHLQWLYRGGYLLCQLPSGRRIAYAEPTVVPTTYTVKWKETVIVNGKEKEVTKSEKKTKDQLRYWAVHPKSKKWMPERTYGGKLAENVTQAVARDVMVESMFRVEAAGYLNIFTVHDEDVTETDEGFGSLEEFENIMSQAPRWADGLPIKVEGWRDYRYKK